MGCIFDSRSISRGESAVTTVLQYYAQIQDDHSINLSGNPPSRTDPQAVNTNRAAPYSTASAPGVKYCSWEKGIYH
ncbi:hypothetical protein N7510_007495 [Penicillium lagena]|uniref:uncharacterized protein n=1 Tax=Penicillium lagena TaxID=94218 RepID=UPI002541730A|nr:uncharacterized protein N7510_007495 [Penicillium lagena]KAJ5610776.1 hypothetical protein N7510_007495 [Penicillium lagena]